MKKFIFIIFKNKGLKSHRHFLLPLLWAWFAIPGINLQSYSQPVAQFSADITAGCTPLVVNFTDLSSGSPTSWSWDFGNGKTSGLQHPSVIYTNPGLYTITLIALNSSGNSTEIKTAYIMAYELPKAGFSSDKRSDCVPFTVNFTDQSAAGSATITDWTWDFGSGSIIKTQNPVITYNSKGLYPVYLFVTDDNGCTDVIYMNDYILAKKPIAGFDVDTLICPANSIVTMTNTSTGNGLTYFWDLGDGTTSTDQHISHNYAAAGTYLVNLIITDSLGCVDSSMKTISLDDFTANFDTVIESVNCITSEFTITFIDSSLPFSNKYHWDFGDGDTSILQNPTHTYDTAGTYIVTLISGLGEGCTDTIVKTVKYSPIEVKFEIDTNKSCQLPFTVTFTNKSTGTGALNYKWDLGDSTFSTDSNIIHTYTQNGLFLDTLFGTDIYGCKGYWNDSVIIEKPVANFSLSKDKGCVPLDVFFNNISYSADSIISFEWNFGDPASGINNTSTDKNPNHIYNNDGIYTVSLIIVNLKGCVDTVIFEKLIKVGLKPDYTNFYTLPKDSICFNSEVEFYDSSGFFDTTLKVNSWCWLFRFSTLDSSTYSECLDSGIIGKNSYYATVKYPIHDYTEYSTLFKGAVYNGDSICNTEFAPEFGNDTVRLIAGYNGCYDTIIKPVYIAAPMAMPGYIFPDSITGFYMKYVYNDNGTVIDSFISCFGHTGSCISTWSPVYGFYNASFRWDSMIYFNIIHQQSGDTIYAFTDPYDTVFISFDRVGVYEINIKVRNDTTGCVDSRTDKMAIDSVRYGFTVSPKDDCLKGNSFQFTDTSTSFYGNIYKTEYSFGDGSYSQNKNPTHVYTSAGVFIITHSVTTIIPNSVPNEPDIYCKFDSYDTITVHNIEPNFYADTLIACTNYPIQFYDSTISTTPIKSWSWDFGDNSPIDTTQNPTHKYTSPGYYTISLTTENTYGCINKMVKDSFIIISKPVANFDMIASSICFGDSLRLINRSYGGGISYYWDFGDGNNSTLKNPVHFYTLSGNYTVSLTVIDTNFCDSTLIKLNGVNVYDYPMAGFSVDSLTTYCPPFLVNFTDTSWGNNTNWFWDFGDGQTSSLQHPMHVYTKSGVFNISLIVTNLAGCKDTISDTGMIYIGGPGGMFSFDPDTGCAPFNVEFITNTTKADYFYWDYGDGIIDIISLLDNGDSVNHLYTKKGRYYPELILQDSLGCKFIPPSPDSIVVDEIMASFVPNDTIRCGYGPITFINTSEIFLPAQFQWSFGTGDSSIQYTPIYTFDTAGVFNVQLFAISEANCSSTYNRDIIVFETPDMNFIISPDTGCIPFRVDFTIPDTQHVPTQWNWDLGNGNVLAGDSVSYSYTSKGTFEVKLTATYGEGNCDEDTLSYIVAGGNPEASFWFEPERPSIKNPEVKFWDSSIDAINWFWLFDTGDSSNLMNPEYKFKDSGYYYIKLKVFNKYGCFDSTIHKIYIAPKVILNVPTAFSPNGDGINDIFHIFDAGMEQLIEFKIYDRWGVKLFETNDPNVGWDGKHNGVSQPIDTYVYFLIAKMAGIEDPVLQKGNILLIR